MLEIQSGSLTIRQAPDGQRAPHGLFVDKGGFTGWDDQPVTRRTTAERPNAHGEFDVPGFLAGRLITIKGVCVAVTEADLQEWRDKIVGHGAAGGSFALSVTRGTVTQSATARLAAGRQTTFEDNGTGLRAAFSMAWWCADPRRYETQTGRDIPTPGSSITLFNRGNFPATPVLRVTGGPLPGGYTITGPGGRQIVVTRALPSGGRHDIDLATGRLFENGARVLRGFGKLQLFAVPPGHVSVSVSAGVLNASMQHTSV